VTRIRSIAPLARRIWLNHFEPYDDDPPPEEALKTEKEQIRPECESRSELPRARGEVLFVRLPSKRGIS